MSPEIDKLARLLGVEPERLAYLEAVEDDALAQLREQVTERIFSAGRHIFARLANASRIVPAPVAATISVSAFGPLLTSRMASTVDPASAIAVAKRLPPEFLADVAVEMDPRRAPEVIGGLPGDLVLAASRVLAERGEWVTMGSFAGHLDDGLIASIARELDDDALARIAAVAEERERLLAALSPDDARRVVAALDGAT